jgi:hypothetical protein
MRIAIAVLGIALLFGNIASAAGPVSPPASPELAGKATPLQVPFAETFAAPQLDATWKVDVAKGNTIKPADGQLVISALENTFAHVERPLGVDFVRVSCGIKPGSGVTWCTSVFIYWDMGNWCQLGIIPASGGRVYVMEMIDQQPHEYELGQVDFAAWQNVAIELGADCIRYFTSPDGNTWRPERVARRPESFSIAPSLLILGKGHGGPAGYNVPDLDANYKTPGATATSAIRDVKVTQVPWGLLRATPAERAAWDAEYLDTMGAAEMKDGADPTFDGVARYLPAQKHPREIVGVKDHPYDIGVAEDGSLQLNAEIMNAKLPVASFEIGAPDKPGQRFGVEPRCRKHLLNGWMPIIVADWERDGLRCEQTVYGWSDGMSPDAPLVGHVRMLVENTGDAPRPVKIALQVAPAELKIAAKDWQLDVPAHGKAALYLTVPYDIAKAVAERIEAGTFDERLAEITAYWQRLIAPGSRFDIPEQRVADAYRAWLSYNFLNVDKRDGVYHVCDGSGFYEQIYGYSHAMYCHMLDLMGYHDQARIYLDSLLTFVQPDGLLCVNFGATDIGATLFTMAEHYRMTRDTEWLKGVAPKMLKMCEWVETHRKESMKTVHGRGTNVWGLVRWRPYCDYILEAYDYFCNGYLCVGMESAADVLPEIGMADEAAVIKREAAAFRKDILKSMDAAVLTRDGMKMLPIMPDTQNLLKETNYTANGYYGLLASCLLESKFLPAGDTRSKWLVDMLEQRGGIKLGVCQWFGQIDHAYAYGYWMNRLASDEPRKAILGLYGSMAYGMARETYSPVECHRIASGENWFTEPHTYSSTMQLHLLRNMLVRESGRDLIIGQAIPRAWLKAGQHVAINEVPTIFGPVSARFESHADNGLITVKLTPPKAVAKDQEAPAAKGQPIAKGQSAPARILVHVRHPESAKIKSVEASPQIATKVIGQADGEEAIELTGVSGVVELSVRY